MIISVVLLRWRGRLRQRLEYIAQGEYPDFSWVRASDIRYIYDGWRVIQERDSNNVPWSVTPAEQI
jgi:hypothetical protein